MRLVILTALTAIGCGSFEQKSTVKDIEGPGRARELIRNIQFSDDFENTLIKFGYQKGSSCIQEVKEILPNGDEKKSFGFYARECPDYAIAAEPKVDLQLLFNPHKANQKVFVMSGRSIASLNTAGKVENLCFKEFSNQCTLKLDDVDGTIRQIKLKTGLDEGPIEARSAKEKAVIYLLNRSDRPQLRNMGLTDQELNLVADYRNIYGKFTTIQYMVDWSSSFSRVPQKLVGFARSFGLIDLASQVIDEAKPIRRIYNHCANPVKVAIRYLDQEWKWQTTSWWKVAADESKTLLLKNKEIFSYARNYYYYAESTDGSGKKWEGDFHFDVQGNSYGFKPLNSEVLTLTCPSS